MAPDVGQQVVFLATGLCKTYQAGDQRVPALRGVDLAVRRGEFVVLVGPSGSGKSTLLNILGGLEAASAGTLLYQDGAPGARPLDLTAADDATLTRYRREHVGFVFQFYNLIPSLTAAENVALVSDIVAHPMPIDEALARVTLLARRDHFPSQLSGGEQQRVAIARAIVKRPQVLLCDEPTGALDYATGKHVLETLADVNTALGTTTVVITHNAAIGAMADRVLTLGDGRIVGATPNARRASPSDLSW